MSVSVRSGRIPSFIVMDVLDRAMEMQRRGADVVHMEVGEPDFDSPRDVVEAGVEALRGGATHYTHSMGAADLREAVSRYYKRRYGVEVDPGRVLVTMGSSPAMLMVFSSLLDPGSGIVIPDPGYPCYRNMIEFLGGVPKPVHVREEDGFEYRLEEIERSLDKDTKAVIVNSPANPTGCVCRPELLKDLAGLGPRVLSDEIYHGMTYEGDAHTILEYTGDAFVISGFSKLWAMTGWRLGWIIAPESFVRPLQKLQQNFFISPSDFAQKAGIAALREDPPELSRMADTYAERRAYLLKALPEIGLPLGYLPAGAFYMFLDVKRYTDDCYRFAFDILENAHVAVTPGVDFGGHGAGYIRLSYANSLENIRKGVERIGKFLKGLS